MCNFGYSLFFFLVYSWTLVTEFGVDPAFRDPGSSPQFAGRGRHGSTTQTCPVRRPAATKHKWAVVHGRRDEMQTKRKRSVRWILAAGAAPPPHRSSAGEPGRRGTTLRRPPELGCRGDAVPGGVGAPVGGGQEAGSSTCRLPAAEDGRGRERERVAAERQRLLAAARVRVVGSG